MLTLRIAPTISRRAGGRVMSSIKPGRSLMRLMWSAALLVTCAAPAVAQSPAVEPSADAADEAQSGAAPRAEADREKPAKRKKRFTWEQHPSVRIAEGTHVDFRARLQ